ncbi:MAG: NF038143 family protein [Planctomycetota bacterium]|jgi:hypothetical protein
MEKSQIIVSAEQQFAREVTLGVIVQKPPSVWQTLIPGMFVINFLRRNRAIWQYTKHYMLIRKLAIDAAQALANGQDKAEVHSQIKTGIENRLNSLNLFSPDLARAQQAAGSLLSDHYLKLLGAEGDTYYVLIRNAYPSREEYAEHLRRLSSAEKEVNRAIVSKSQQLKEKLQLEEQQVARRRKKIMEDIY